MSCLLSRADCTSYGPSDDQRLTVRRNPADETTNLEYGNRDHESWFQLEILVRLSPCRLERRNGKKEGGPVPADVIEAVEFISDPWDSSCDNGHIKGKQED